MSALRVNPRPNPKSPSARGYEPLQRLPAGLPFGHTLTLGQHIAVAHDSGSQRAPCIADTRRHVRNGAGRQALLLQLIERHQPGLVQTNAGIVEYAE